MMRFFLPLLLLAAFAATAQASPSLSQQRERFVQAEQALGKNNTIQLEALLAQLIGYPLYPHLLAEQLSGRLADSRAIEGFLAQYGDIRPANQLRQRWLAWLADSGDWPRFFAHYQSSDGNGLRCSYHYGQIQSGRAEEGYAGGESLWLAGNSLPDACDRLFAALHNAGRLSRNEIWRRFELALQHKKPQLAESIEIYMDADDRHAAAAWLKLHNNPRLALDCGAWPVAGALGGKLFVHALDRLAASDVRLARSLWQTRRARFDVSATDAAYMERRLALALALSRHDDAYPALDALPADLSDEDVRAWRLRAALLRQDWRAVLSAWQRLSDAEKIQPEWRYWQARALEQLGEKQAANEVYAQAAQQRDFFGFLAADRIDADYHTAHQPVPVDAADLQRLAMRPAFQAVSEWRALGRDNEARAEWNYALKQLPTKDVQAASKLAQEWGWNAMAIATAARAGSWDDLSIRFPMAYENAVLRHADRQQLDPGMVYGLIRQESAFDPDAKSPVGARGLMQIMPATGQSIAKILREKLPSVSLLSDPDTNLRYGTFFFKDLLERFQSNFAMAAAAYNAGPARVHRWLPSNGPLPSDIWLEQIPFTETRHYVSTVLANAVVYQDRLGGAVKRRIGQFLPDVPAASSSREDGGGAVADCF